MAALLCSEADVRQRVQRWVLATFLATDLANSAAYLVGEEDSADGIGLITSWSAQFENDIGRSIALRTETIALHGSGTNEIILPKQYTPVLAIHGINCTGLGDDVTSYGFDGATGRIWLTDDTSVRVTETSTWGVPRLGQPRWPAGRGNLTIKLTHGERSIPIPVRNAVRDRVAADVLIEDRARRDQGLASKTLGDRSESYGKGRWSDEVDKLIANYEAQVSRLSSLVSVG